jgi:hypothetical protein
MGNLLANSISGGIITCFKNGLGHMANYYKFNLGRSALKIKPGESFKGTANWPVQIPIGNSLSLANNCYSLTETTISGFWHRLSLIGLSWQPL